MGVSPQPARQLSLANGYFVSHGGAGDSGAGDSIWFVNQKINWNALSFQLQDC